MKITYTGRHIGLGPSQTEELEAEFAKISKMMDTAANGEAEARVVLKHEHDANQAEVVVAWRHHEIAAESEHADLFTAVHQAVAKVQAQVIRQLAKARETRHESVH